MYYSNSVLFKYGVCVCVCFAKSCCVGSARSHLAGSDVCVRVDLNRFNLPVYVGGCVCWFRFGSAAGASHTVTHSPAHGELHHGQP